jgi:BirA family transcriptional regulator, biotin operon repressor / biotin---[acetyl-CoA-carboxylase] ligase
LSDDALGARVPPGYRLVCHDSIGSTNDEAKCLARGGAAAGTVVWALQQTAGRGRRGRAWVSPRGNLYVSILMRPDCPADRAAQLGFVTALAIGGAVKEIFPALDGLSYKWPNDVLLNGRKIAGILLESEMATPDRLSFLVAGVGINLVTAPQHTEFPATSVAEHGLGEVAPVAMLEVFLRHFRCWEQRWREDGFSPVRAAWRAAAASSPGEAITVRLETDTLFGRFIDLDEQGALLLDCAGELRRISAGEVMPANR